LSIAIFVASCHCKDLGQNLDYEVTLQFLNFNSYGGKFGGFKEFKYSGNKTSVIAFSIIADVCTVHTSVHFF